MLYYTFLHIGCAIEPLVREIFLVLRVVQGLIGEEKGEVGDAKLSDRLKVSGSSYGRNGRT